MKTFEKMTYEGSDFVAFLELADPNILEVHHAVRSLRDACKGIDGGRYWTIKWVRHWLELARLDTEGVEDFVGETWDDGQPGDDLRTLAMRQANQHRDDAFDMELSDNHPDMIAAFCRDRLKNADDLEAWADKPRQDEHALCEREWQEEQRPKWPWRLVYEQMHGAQNARLFVGQRPFKTLSSDDVLFSLRDGAWQETSDAAMAAEVRATDPGDKLDVQHVNKIVEGIHQLKTVAAKPFEWIEPRPDDPKPTDLALFRNGLLDVSTGRLIPHDGRYFATGLPEHDWDPLAECPTWMAWLDQTLDSSFHPTLQEWFGYCMTADVSAHKFMVLLGGPRSGKSTAHGVLHGLIGIQHSSPIMMPDLGGDFGLESLVDKRLAIIPDAHDAPARNRGAALERIKSITGGDPVSVNRKNKQIIQARLKTRLLVTCNRLPKFIDESGALAKRMLIVRFENSFMDREDRTMGDRLAAEAPGIANWALQGLSRLRANGLKFTVGEGGKKEVELAAMTQSHAARFAQERLKITGDLKNDFCPMRGIYRAYEEWANEEGMYGGERRTQNDLWQDIVAAIPSVRYVQRRIEGKQTYGLSGVQSAELLSDD